MVADITALLFIALITVRGYLRGLLAQVAVIGAAVALWLTFELWFPSVDGWLAARHETFASYSSLRRLVAFSGAYALILLLVSAIEHLVVEQVALLKAGNSWAGAALGLSKGLVYAAVAIWLIQVAVAGGEAIREQPTPDWMADSVAFEKLALWNPVRLSSARELLDASGTEAWGRRTWAQLARDPRLQRILEARAAELDVPPVENQDQDQEPGVPAPGPQDQEASPSPSPEELPAG
ncbi:MAG: hypothetical protein CMP23_04000 [Rickettsiales bacterium]|nr:hypothetical protein [Rickettsiales bacterium]|tara:strand:+ start:2209 stop:2919 length:711 start_codon:yes stop_codon:yes gene_type:complete